MTKPTLALTVVFLFACSFASSAQSLCDDAEIFRPLIGEWQESDLNDKTLTPTGSLSTQLAANNCALKQSYFSFDNVRSYESQAYVDEAGIWRETYVWSDGSVRHYRWHQNEEELILNQIELAGPNWNRLVIFDVTDLSYKVLEENSTDRGQSWERQRQRQFTRLPQPLSKD